MSITDSETSQRREDLTAAVLAAGRELGAAAVFFHTNVAAQLGLGATETKTLDLLQRHGPLSPMQLSDLAGLTRPSITATIDRLEHKGLVRRQPHPSDGRRLLIEIAAGAFERMAPLYEGLATTMTDMLDDYSDDELRLLARAFADAATRQMDAALDLTGT